MVLTSSCFDELFSARVSGHRAQRLAQDAQPGKELIVNPTLSPWPDILLDDGRPEDAGEIVRVLIRTKLWRYLPVAEVTL